MRGLFYILFILSISGLFGQVESNIYGVGDWHNHSSFSAGYQVAIAGNKVYCNAETGLFYYDKEDNSINKLSKIDGLSDSQIASIAYSTNEKALIVAYINGNLDILKNNRVYNINGIKESSNITGSKRINHISMKGEFAYLSCDFGLVKVDLDKAEIKDSYLSIGPNGSNPEIYQSAIVANSDSIFIASSSGILVASLLPNYNLSDFNNWKQYTQANGIDTLEIKFISSLNDTAYAYSSSGGLLYKKGENWVNVIATIADKSKATSLDNSHGELFLSFTNELGSYKILSNDSYSVFSTSPKYPYHFQYDNDNVLWAADGSSGLVRMNSNNSKEVSMSPNGPAHSEVFRMYGHDDKVFGLSGGYQGSYVGSRNYNLGFYQNEEFVWTNHDFYDAYDLIDMVYSDGLYYIGSFQNGLLQWNGKWITKRYDQNSFTIENGDTLWCPLLPYSGGNRIRIPDVTVDKSGNIWVCNHLSKSDPQTPIHKLSPNGKWTSYTLNNINASAPIMMVIDDLGTKWITLSGNEGRKGGYVFNDEFGYEKYLSESSVGLPDTKVTVMTVDKTNNVWIGTAKGIAVAKDVGNVFLNTYKVEIPISGNRPLLEDEFINDIVVDGGNRIWIGTTNGAFLLSPGGEEVLLNFTEKNSLLTSDNVSSIAINEKTGEVFFGSEKGIVSFWGDATEGEETHSDVKIFPNPVRPGFDGILGITGLANSSVVKFTDVSGNLVYETDANGGMATWDMKDVNGNEVSPGVYLIFSSSIDGEDAYVGKVAVVK